MKTKTEHTPMPWKIDDDSQGFTVIVGGKNYTRTVCLVGPGEDPSTEPDARLLCAAPEMAEALREIAERGPVEGYLSASALRVRLVGTQSIARAALRKIEGREG